MLARLSRLSVVVIIALAALSASTASANTSPATKQDAGELTFAGALSLPQGITAAGVRDDVRVVARILQDGRHRLSGLGWWAVLASAAALVFGWRRSSSSVATSPPRHVPEAPLGRSPPHLSLTLSF